MNTRLVGAAFVAMAVCLTSVPSAHAQSVCDGVSQTSNTSLVRVSVVTGLTNRPLYVTAPPGDVNRIFVVEQNGFIRVKQRGSAPGTFAQYIRLDQRINSTGDEQGLLGLAFDPDFATNRYFYVNFTTNGIASPCAGVVSGDNVVARFTEGGGGLADPASGVCILSMPGVESNHNGGQLFFGTDEKLYIFTGDGGSGGDPHGACGNGQSTTTLLGKMLRVDPIVPERPMSPGLPECSAGQYRIPADNPLVGAASGCDEIYAYGLRNPWRNAMDPANGDLYLADVGQGCWEEVSWLPGGARTCREGVNIGQTCTTDPDCPGSVCVLGGHNFGWRQMEGNHCFNNAAPGNCNPASANGCSPPCNDPSLTDPIFEFTSSGVSECSITGGFVYRGCRMPNFDGKYFYGDYCSGMVKSTQVVGGVPTNVQTWTPQLTFDFSFNLTSFGTDAQGEIYFTKRSPGEVYLITAPFGDLQVSGQGATPFSVQRDVPWSWEDLAFTSMHPVSLYRIYRSDPITEPGTAADYTFTCIHTTTGTTWAGDPLVPADGEARAYLVTAVNTSGVESSAGGPARVLLPGCP